MGIGRAWRTRARAFALFGVVILAALATELSAQTWDVQYNASSLVMPEASGTGWAFSNNGSGFQRAFVGNELYENTMAGNQFNAMGWENVSGHFDFNTGFVVEARLKMVSATNSYDRWGGAEVYTRSAAGYNMDIQVDPNKVNLGSIFDYVSYPMITPDAFHTYRAEAVGNQGQLYIDGVLRLQMPLTKDNPIRQVWFGDQGWEGGEMYFDYVRYGALPEPATGIALAAMAVPQLLLRRRPRGGRVASRASRASAS